MENIPEIKINQESVSKALSLSRTIERNKVLGDSSPESAEKARTILGGSFAANYESVEEMINTTRDLEGKTEIQRKNAEEALNLLGSAICLTENGKANDLFLQGKLSENLPSNLVGIEKYVAENLLVSGEDDEVGKEIVNGLIGLEKINRRAALAPATFAEKREVETKKVIENLCDRFDQVDPDSEDGLKIGAVVGCLDRELVKMPAPEKKQSENKTSNETQKGNRNEELFDPRYELRNLNLENSEEVLNFSRKLLDKIENSSYKSNDLAISNQTTTFLNNIKDYLRPKMEEDEGKKDVYREIDARLALHDSAFYMANSGFKLGEHGGIVEALDKIGDEGRSLDKDRLKFLLKDSTKDGLPIPEAWDYMEKANFNYKDLLKKVADDKGFSEESEERKDLLKIKKVSEVYGKGTTVEGRDAGYWLDMDDKRKAWVDAYIIKMISEEKDGKEMDGAKALQLAKKLIEATGERSVFNFALVNGDNFAEVIHFAYFRADDARKGKNVGPMSTMGIQTLTPGWLRSMSKWDTNSGKEINTEIKAANIDFDNNDGKNTCDYYHRQIVLAKIQPLKGALLDNSPDPKKIVASGAAYFNSIVDAFNKAEPAMDLIEIPGKGYADVREYNLKEAEEYNKNHGDRKVKKGDLYLEGIDNSRVSLKKDSSIEGFRAIIDGKEITSVKSREGKNNLRSMYALGLLELVGTKPSLGWTPDQIMELRKIMVETNLSTSKPFLNEKMWDWANKQVIANDGHRDYTFKQALMYNRRVAVTQSFWKGFLKGVSGNKK